MSQQNIISEINSTLSSEFELSMDKLVPEATLFEDLGLDSLDAVDMLVILEDRVGIKLNVEQLQHARTLEDIYKLVEEIGPKD